jgi:glucose-6-phosphate isomerase
MISLDVSLLEQFVSAETRSRLQPRLEAAHHALVNRSGAGSEFTGWLDIPSATTRNEWAMLLDTAAEISDKADVLLCIGIGGSYLGAKAVIDALSPYFGRKSPEIRFAGHHMSGLYLKQLLEDLEGKSVYVTVISKSGTTLEPALAFRIVLEWMDKRFPDVDQRISVITDPDKGALNELRKERHFRKFTIPPDVGGRFSVLTPVGLLPIAAAGIDIDALLTGALHASSDYKELQDNPSLEYAANRYLLHEMGFKIEILSLFEPRMSPFGGWWQQLFGESEGKNHRGLYPDTLQYSTDLHSLGQYVQDGQRTVTETFLMLEDDEGDIPVPDSANNLDRLNYLAGKKYSDVNRKAYQGTAQAHVDGGVPVQTLWLSTLSPETVGRLIYFFEHAVSVGGYLLGINPFDQPGVEAYKKEMFRLLGKP